MPQGFSYLIDGCCFSQVSLVLQNVPHPGWSGLCLPDDVFESKLAKLVSHAAHDLQGVRHGPDGLGRLELVGDLPVEVEARMGHDQRICSPQSNPKFFEVKMGLFQVREIFEISRVQADVVVEEALEGAGYQAACPRYAPALPRGPCVRQTRRSRKKPRRAGRVGWKAE